MRPASQFLQNPHAMLNGSTTTSPTFTRTTPSPTAMTSPMFSWPSTLPVSTSVRPSYMWRSLPQMFVVVMRTRASVGRSILASGTSSIVTFFGPW